MKMRKKIEKKFLPGGPGTFLPEFNNLKNAKTGSDFTKFLLLQQKTNNNKLILFFCCKNFVKLHIKIPVRRKAKGQT